MLKRNTHIQIDEAALLHNLCRLKQAATGTKVVAMVKANAYGCGISQVIPTLEGKVDYYGVISRGEALAIRKLGARTPCLVIQGVFSPEEWRYAAEERISYVIHSKHQLEWLLQTPLPQAIPVWVKLNTGMNRLGLKAEDASEVLQALENCTWVQANPTLMMHFANADFPKHPSNAEQIQAFQKIKKSAPKALASLSNSAAIFAFPDTHADFIRPGIALYGASPFDNQPARSLGLKPVMSFHAPVMEIYSIDVGDSVGYGYTWKAKRPTRLGLIAAGYGDGYPRVVAPGTPVWINGHLLPIVGRISMDSMAVDLTDAPSVEIGQSVELWGKHLPVEQIAKAANTIAYELLCKVITRPTTLQCKAVK